MKKVLLSALLAVVLPSMAQQAVSTAASPTVLSPVMVSPNAAAALASATTNKIFLDQSGDNPNVNLNQVGNGNRQGSSASPVYLRGTNQTLTTVQTGNNNEIDLAIKNPSSGTNVGATAMIQQIGDGNKIDAACGYGSSSDGGVTLQGCKAADLNWRFSGNSNKLQFRGTGDNLSSQIDVSGHSNEFYIDSLTDNNSQAIKVMGDSNIFNIKQNSTGGSGSSVEVDLSGTGNKLNVTQSGAVDNVLSIKGVSNSGTFNITQKLN